MNQRTIVLGIIAALLTVIVVLRYTVWSEGGNPAVIQPAPPSTSVVTIREETGDFLPQFSSFSAISDRPLFRSDRRPAPPEVIETPVIETPVLTQQGEPSFTVIGTVTGPDGGVATIRSDNETSRAYVGDTIEGWRIDTITSRDVEVSRDSDRYRIPIGERE